MRTDSKKFSSWTHGVSVVAVIQNSREMGLAQDPTGHSVANSDVLGFNAPGKVPLPIGGVSWNGGAGKVFRSRGATRNAFHCPIPTPTFFGLERPTLSRVMFLYACSAGVRIELLRLYDGPAQVGIDVHPQTAANYDGSAKAQDLVAMHTLFTAADFGLNGETAFHWGLDLLVVVSFDEAGSQITFTGAGAEFNVET